ncbi:MAG TPA: hypothetical protein VFW27_26735, partial [Actinoplanes sp.]|nr:hypothetical protein [Actinoplanes sp.]
MTGTDFGATCAVRTDHTGWCWGTNRDALLGVGKLPRELHGSPVPMQVAGLWSSIEYDSSVACGLQIDHTLWCWGAPWV